MTHCGVCGHDAWQIFEHLTFGVWQAEGEHLQRDTQDYPLGQCQRCGHVQSLTEYTEELLQTLYFHGPQEQVFWHEQLVNSKFPYQQMVNLFAEYLPQHAKITDLGCGPGALLTACRSRFPDASLTGVDFNDRCAMADIEYHSANIALPDTLAGLLPAASQDLVCASHTLEHLPAPGAFLKAAANLLNRDGILFIEVPDFTQPLPEKIAGQSNLINLQHIHYFSEANLLALALNCGLEPVKVHRVTTGYIPRLMLLLKPAAQAVTADSFVMDAGIRANIESAYRQADNCRRRLADKLNSVLSHPDKSVALWGIGADAFLLSQSDAFRRLLSHPRLSLHDYQWAGKQLDGKMILGSDQLQQTDAEIFLLPSLAETRVKMHALAKSWQIAVNDPYDPDNFPQPSPAPCQLCQTDQWQPIATLNTGVWDKSEKALQRVSLAFPIAECKHCNHVQISKAHSENDISALYFSGGGQPEMWPVRTDGSNAYKEMVSAIGSALIEASSIADFGCGEGLLLAEMAAAHPAGEYIGIDFNPVGEDSFIKRVRCDLNQQAQLLTVAGGKQFDLITASHVLEHLISPVGFLTALRERLTDKGIIFVEVPDASFNPDNHLHETNLIHGQHLHYFTKDSAAAFAAAAGLECLATHQLHTDSIPRLQLLLKKGDKQPLSRKLPTSAKASIVQRFHDYEQELDNRAAKLLNALSVEQKVALWGIGGDLWQLLNRHPQFIESIKSGQLIMLDRELAGHELYARRIASSDCLTQESLPVLITPIYLPTKSHMLALSKSWPCKAIQ